MSLGQNINLISLDYSIAENESLNNNPYTYLYNNNIFPSTSFLNDDKDKLKIQLNNTILKRACCMRKNASEDSNTVVFQYRDEYNNNKDMSITVNELNKYCNDIEYIDNGGGIKKTNYTPQSPGCDNFYYTYCKTLAAFNQDDVNEDNYNQDIKYADINAENTGKECSCINSPILNQQSFNPAIFTEDNIYTLDKYCNNNNVYLTDKIKQSTKKNIVLNICQNVIGGTEKVIGGLKQSFDNVKTVCNISNNPLSNNTSSNNTPLNNTPLNNTPFIDTPKTDTPKTDKDKTDDKKEGDEEVIFLGLKENELIGLSIVIILIVAFLIVILKK